MENNTIEESVNRLHEVIISCSGIPRKYFETTSNDNIKFNPACLNELKVIKETYEKQFQELVKKI
jgi:hypothetical protein